MTKTGSGEPRLSAVIALEGLKLGGTPVNALDLGRTLRDRGHRVSVCAIDEPAEVSLLPYAEQQGFSVDILPANDGVGGRGRRLAAVARRARADVLHVYGPWLSLPASIAAAGARVAPVMTNWNMENVTYTPRGVAMIVGTSAMYDEAATLHRGRSWLMEPPVDLAHDRPDSERAAEFRGRWGVESHDVLAVIVSRLDTTMKSESIEHTMRAIEAMDRAELRLALVGDGDAADRLGALATEINTRLGRPAIIPTGALIDPRPAYAAADIVVGMGGSALRGLAHAAPVIVVGTGGFATTFTPQSKDLFYRDGFFGQEDRADPVAHLVGLLGGLMDPSTRQALGEYGLGEVSARFSLEVAGDRLEKIYAAAIADRTQRGSLVDAASVWGRASARIAVDRVLGRGGER